MRVLLIGTKVPHELAQPCRVPFLESENLGWGSMLCWSDNIPSLGLSFLFL